MPSQLETDLVFMHLLIHSVQRWLTRGRRTHRLQNISFVFHRGRDIDVLVTKNPRLIPYPTAQLDILSLPRYALKCSAVNVFQGAFNVE